MYPSRPEVRWNVSQHVLVWVLGKARGEVECILAYIGLGIGKARGEVEGIPACIGLGIG